MAIPIDVVEDDLREWATSLRIPLRLWIVLISVDFGEPENVMYELPEEFGSVAANAVEDEETQTDTSRFWKHA